jgi:myo-inositol-1(or 4)-monophosphatase
LPAIDTRLAAVRAIAIEAGAMAMAKWRGDFAQWDKSHDNPVSEVDLAVDAFLREQLFKLDPEAGWLSEETADSAERLMCPRVWVVDPIDGTRDFVKGRRGWAVSIALVEGGRPLIGVLDAPARGEHWWAAAGEGGYRNDVRLTASRCTDLVGARVPADMLAAVDRDLTCVDRPNSVALRIGMVAADEADLLATLRWGSEWDIAAAALIAEEAGATVTDARGQTIRYNSTKGEAFGVLATSPDIHRHAVARLADRAAKAIVR